MQHRSLPATLLAHPLESGSTFWGGGVYLCENRASKLSKLFSFLFSFGVGLPTHSPCILRVACVLNLGLSNRKSICL